MQLRNAAAFVVIVHEDKWKKEIQEKKTYVHIFMAIIISGCQNKRNGNVSSVLAGGQIPMSVPCCESKI
jgi:hypothetical protein